MTPAARRYRLLVFDWDGTLADSTTIIAEAIQAALRDMGEAVPEEIRGPLRHRARPCRRATHRRARASRASAFRACRALPQALPRARGRHSAVRRRCGHAGRARSGRIFPGGCDRQDTLGLDRVLVKNGLRTRFHATRCADEGFPKPHPDMLLHLMDRLDVTPEATLMIGDTTHDIELARNAGVMSVAVAYGAHDPEGLARQSPLAVVHSVAELRTWLAANG